MNPRPPYASVFLLSAAALAYEILLMRLFSVIQWHHFAYMIIGLALLGYGASGTVVAIGQRRFLRFFDTNYQLAAALFPVTAVACFLLAQQIPFNAEEILWDGRQILYLCVLFVLLSMPFFFVASAICLVLMRHHSCLPRVYAADLAGAGSGGLGAIFLLYTLPPLWALLAVGAVGVGAGLLAAWELNAFSKKTAAVALAGMCILIVIASNAELLPSPYKAQRQLLRIEGSRIVSERSSPLGLISVVESGLVPLRHAPGLSVNARGQLPVQMGLFTDGGNMAAMAQKPSARGQLKYLDYLTSALAYHLGFIGRVFVVGAGGGADVLQARYHQATRIDVAELNPQVVDLVDRTHASFTGSPFSTPDVHLRIGDVREILERLEDRYDLIQISLADAFNSSSSGLHALQENYLYTVEAVQLYLRRLAPSGYLAITRWSDVPPREILKLTATATDALARGGVGDPENRLILIRGWQTATLLIKGSRLSQKERDAARSFAKTRAFDLVHLSDLRESEANRYNRLPSPQFYRAAKALLGSGREDFLRAYKFDLRPATDDRPFFHHFFKWSAFVELFDLRARGGMPLIEWGYLILLATLAIALVLGFTLIILPLWYFLRLPERPKHDLRRRYVFLYFFSAGLAFMFVEIALLQKFVLYLHHPVYSAATTLTSLLIFAGLGSQWSVALSSRWGERAVLTASVAVIAVVGAAYLWCLGSLFAQFASLSLAVKMFVSALLVAPLGVAMGMPLPLALSALDESRKQYLPWAWGINGCASVIGASLATIVAINYGFSAVVLIALLLYSALPRVFPRTKHTSKSHA